MRESSTGVYGTGKNEKEQICESGDEVALAVKINDIQHNLKRGRAGGHMQFVEKHTKALAYIEDYIQRNRK